MIIGGELRGVDEILVVVCIIVVFWKIERCNCIIVNCYVFGN